MASTDELKKTARHLCRRGRGILAADESVGTIGKRLTANGLSNTTETRRAFREILITSPGNEEAYSGIILFHETLYQHTSDATTRFVDVLNKRGILPGVKVDAGLQPLEKSPRETLTKGLDGLQARCEEYVRAGARFAKWRAALRVDVAEGLPTDAAVLENAASLARYAAIAQSSGLVPIVEPEILIDGAYTLEESALASRRVISACVEALRRDSVVLEATLLKVMMVLPGLSCPNRGSVTSQQIANKTLETMISVVPPEIPGIMFLSGGMGEVEATRNLNAINLLADGGSFGDVPWSLSFSFGRALQSSALELWKGKDDMVDDAMKVAAALGVANAQAQLGQFEGVHPSVGADQSLYEGFRGWRNGEDPKG